MESYCDPVKIGSKLLEPFSSLAGFDMAIEDHERLVLGGTGKWIPKVGTYRPEGSYFDLTLKTGEPYACTDPKASPQCRQCPIREHCPYSVVASHPVIYDDQIKGLIGYLGYNNQQRDLFLEKKPVLLETLKQLAVIVSILGQGIQTACSGVLPIFVENILNEMQEGILFLDSGLRITFANKAATTVMSVDPAGLIGQRLSSKIPGAENAFKELTTSGGLPGATAKMNKVVNDRLHGTVSLHQWHETKTRVIILKNHFPQIGNPSPSPPGQEFEGILGNSEAIKNTKTQAIRLAKTDIALLILGETGVGKELFARAIHKVSNRTKMPFVTVNCAAIPETLAESELFGYTRGAFSGANRMGKPGKFETAHGGTLFLDEIGELSLNTQSKLLRAVEQMEIEKVGAVQKTKIDIRIIAATNRDLKSLVDKGKFREDLYYRLNILPLRIPPLRERKEDIPLLIGHFFKAQNEVLSEKLTPEIMAAMLSYDWPGNIRELKNVCHYLAAGYDGKPLAVQDLPVCLRETLSPLPNRAEANRAEPSPGAMQTVNNLLIRQALDRHGYSTAGKRKAAAALGISLSTLYRTIKKYNI